MRRAPSPTSRAKAGRRSRSKSKVAHAQAPTQLRETRERTRVRGGHGSDIAELAARVPGLEADAVEAAAAAAVIAQYARVAGPLTRDAIAAAIPAMLRVLTPAYLAHMCRTLLPRAEDAEASDAAQDVMNAEIAAFFAGTPLEALFEVIADQTAKTAEMNSAEAELLEGGKKKGQKRPRSPPRPAVAARKSSRSGRSGEGGGGHSRRASEDTLLQGGGKDDLDLPRTHGDTNARIFSLFLAIASFLAVLGALFVVETRFGGVAANVEQALVSDTVRSLLLQHQRGADVDVAALPYTRTAISSDAYALFPSPPEHLLSWRNASAPAPAPGFAPAPAFARASASLFGSGSAFAASSDAADALDIVRASAYAESMDARMQGLRETLARETLAREGGRRQALVDKAAETYERAVYTDEELSEVEALEATLNAPRVLGMAVEAKAIASDVLKRVTTNGVALEQTLRAVAEIEAAGSRVDRALTLPIELAEVSAPGSAALRHTIFSETRKDAQTAAFLSLSAHMFIDAIVGSSGSARGGGGADLGLDVESVGARADKLFSMLAHGGDTRALLLRNSLGQPGSASGSSSGSAAPVAQAEQGVLASIMNAGRSFLGSTSQLTPTPTLTGAPRAPHFAPSASAVPEPAARISPKSISALVLAEAALSADQGITKSDEAFRTPSARTEVVRSVLETAAASLRAKASDFVRAIETDLSLADEQHLRATRTRFDELTQRDLDSDRAKAALQAYDAALQAYDAASSDLTAARGQYDLAREWEAMARAASTTRSRAAAADAERAQAALFSAAAAFAAALGGAVALASAYAAARRCAWQRGANRQRRHLLDGAIAVYCYPNSRRFDSAKVATIDVREYHSIAPYAWWKISIAGGASELHFRLENEEKFASFDVFFDNVVQHTALQHEGIVDEHSKLQSQDYTALRPLLQALWDFHKKIPRSPPL